MKNQAVTVEYSCRILPESIKNAVGNKKIFAVCGHNSLRQKAVRDLIDCVGCAEVFSDFEPNPDFGSVLSAGQLFKSSGCEVIFAVGGGSAIDVAKCVKYYADTDFLIPSPVVLPQENDTVLIAVPTTAGTGSEATRFAVVYYNGEKQSIERDDLLPQYVILDALLLETLPRYQRAATAFDALCHSAESLLSVKSTAQSREYAEKAIALFFNNYRGYIENVRSANEKMLVCANLAGQAINISKTTAAHAMCYKITTLKGIAHGHAAALCLPPVLRHIGHCSQQCTDKRGVDYLHEISGELCRAFSCESIDECAELLEKMTAECFKDAAIAFSRADIDAMVSSVNQQRLANSPVPFDDTSVRKAYTQIASFCERNRG